MKILDSGAMLTESSISEFEEQLNIKLPQDYREFMLLHNGGRPEERWVFSFVEAGTSHMTESLISYFEILYDEESEKFDDLKAGYVALVESEQIPQNLLPIADDPFGNIIFMCVSGDDYGKICFGDHELEDPETGYIVMSPIADSFTEFINGLYISEDE